MTFPQRMLSVVLTIIARMYLWRFKPILIAVTGNAGKTTTKNAIAAVLAKKHYVRASGGNMNNELGVPATIIGDFSESYTRSGGTPLFWLSVLVRAKLGLLKSRHSYPDVLVLEFGADKPGDIAHLVKSFPPHISVVTQVGEIPAHVEFFASPQELADEKANILKHLLPTDYAVIGADDLTVLEMRQKTRAHVITFGLGDGSDVQATDVHPRISGARTFGVAFDVHIDGHSMPVTINGVLGSGIARASAAAIAVGRILNIGLADAVQTLATFRPPAGRLRILDGIRNTLIIDDTYNASPAAMHLAIDAVRHIPASRHVLVLGDMLELGAHSIQAHQAVGTMAATVANILVAVGERGRFIADAAGNQIPKESIHWAPDARSAALLVQSLIRSGDLVLIKGSQGMRMERITQELMAEPDRAGELLVRQSARWLAK